MNSEELLKSISNLIKKNERFFIDHPELFLLVQDRLVKAVYDDEEDHSDEGPTESDLLDNPEDYDNENQDSDADPESDNADSEDWLAENDPEYDKLTENDPEMESFSPDQHDVAYDPEEEQDASQEPNAPAETPAQAPEKTKKPSASGHRDWEPKSKYSPEQDAIIKQHIADGWSPREAERFAGAHDVKRNFDDALKSKTKPSEPSAKMAEKMKQIAITRLQEMGRTIAASSEAKKNPIKHASEKALQAHESAAKDFDKDYNTFLQSPEIKDLRGSKRNKAVHDWQEQWHAKNPEHANKVAAAADVHKIHDTAMQERAKHREESAQDIAGAHHANPEGMTTASEFSTGAAGGTEGVTHQGAAQMAGGAEDEEGRFSTGIESDPAAAFAAKNPAYVKQLQTKQQASSGIDLNKLKGDMGNRLQTLKAVKKVGE